MHTATVEELQTDSTSLLTRVRDGEEVVITQLGEPVARLISGKFSDRDAPDWSGLDSQIESPDWHGEVLAERERLIESGEDQLVDWETAKEQLRNELL